MHMLDYLSPNKDNKHDYNARLDLNIRRVFNYYRPFSYVDSE